MSQHGDVQHQAGPANRLLKTKGSAKLDWPELIVSTSLDWLDLTGLTWSARRVDLSFSISTLSIRYELCKQQAWHFTYGPSNNEYVGLVNTTYIDRISNGHTSAKSIFVHQSFTSWDTDISFEDLDYLSRRGNEKRRKIRILDVNQSIFCLLSDHMTTFFAWLEIIRHQHN